MAIDAGTIYSQVRVELDKLRADVSSVKTEFSKLNTNVQNQTSQTTKTATEGFNKYKLAGVAAIGAVTLAFKSAITTFAKTEQSLANVRAVSGATAEEFTKIEEAAASAGRTTRFTASQAADALYYLASAGLDATESIESLDGVLLLAGATGSDLAFTAQTLTATLSQFDIATENSADVSNIFAAAIANSQATMEKLSVSLQQAGPIAAGLGISLEETVGALQLLFNAGFKGEAAGRALKSALADLANESSASVQKLQALGIAFEDINPEIVGLEGSIRTLEDANLSIAQTIDVFGKVAGPQLATLIKEGSDSLHEYTAAVTGTDEAARQYAIQNDTLAGSIDKFKSATEGATNSLIKTLTPALRGILDFGSAVLNFFTSLPDVLKAVGGGAAAGAVGVGVLSTAMNALGIAIALPLGPIAAVAGLAAGIVLLGKRFVDLKKQKNEEQFGEIAKEAIKAKGTVEDVEKETQKFYKTANKVASGFKELENFDDAGTMRDAIREATERFGLTNDQVNQIIQSSDKLSDSLKDRLELANQEINKTALLREYTKGVAEEQREINRLKSFAADITNEIIEEEKYNQYLLQQKKLREEELRALREEELKRSRELIGNLKIYDELAAKGGIDQIEALKAKVQLRQEEIDGLRSISLTQGTVSDETIKKIKEQQNAIDNYLVKIDELEKIEEQKSKTASQAINEELANRKVLAQLIEDDEKRAYEEFLINLELKKQALLDAGADELEVSKYVTDEKNQYEVDAEERKERDKAAIRLRYADETLELAGSFLDALSGLYSANLDKRIAEIDAETQARIEAAGVAEETTLQKIQRELDEAIAAGDAETAAEKEDELLRQKIIEDGERQIAQATYEAEKAQWRFQLAAAYVNAAQAILKAYATIPPPFNIPAAAAQGVLNGIQIAAITAQEPQPPQLATGGVILPQNGGVQTIQAENGFPEVDLNMGPSGTGVINALASRIASQIGSTGKNITIIVELNREVLSESVVNDINDGRVRLKT